MRDLIAEKAHLAESFRATIKEQLPYLSPHFPKQQELRIAHEVYRVQEEMHPRTELDREMQTIVSYLLTFREVSPLGSSEVVWIGNRKHPVSNLMDHCLRKNGELSAITRLGADPNGSVIHFLDMTHIDDFVLENAPNFVFINRNKMSLKVAEWYRARRFVNKYAAEFGIS